MKKYNNTMDKESDDIPLQQCDWKLISKLSWSIELVEKVFGKIPNKYKKLFKNNGSVME